ncbi:hypothetical protein KFE25_011605 [Diacronema lutheri]|uniref:Uncharacterized protein n=1 Tax=Diacronema lutheri TaxID=2081491 RepID=A0A8J6CA14_DIALT|nr:hypothetical protein KFE25_011605 [Diacronema lutheri]
MENKSVARGMFYGGFASCVAETITMPVDVVKTRLQMDGGGGAARMYTGSLDCAAKLTAGEGVGALFKGLPPALVRQSTYGSMRYGFYSPLRDMLGIEPGKPVPLWKKIVAGAGSGAIASALANPTDLVKVRMQTDGMNKGPDGKFLPKKYTGMVNCFLTTVREEGVMALWKGVGPTVGRATALAAAELATYDEVKTQFKKNKVFTQDGLPLHVSTSFIAGYVSTVASSPFDVVKSRVMGQPLDAAGMGTRYSGMLDCFGKVIATEGPMALYNGFWANFGRVVPRVTIVFIVMEQLKAKMG